MSISNSLFSHSLFHGSPVSAAKACNSFLRKIFDRAASQMKANPVISSMALLGAFMILGTGHVLPRMLTAHSASKPKTVTITDDLEDSPLSHTKETLSEWILVQHDQCPHPYEVCMDDPD
jgi:hypothetical protein